MNRKAGREDAGRDSTHEERGADVELIHRPIFREPRDPVEGRESVPWWLWAIGVAVVFWGGWYLGRYGGEFGTAVHTSVRQRDAVVTRESRSAEAGVLTDPVAAGEELYRSKCQSCHQPGGEGLPGSFPPLVGSEWVIGDPETLARIVLGGLTGPVRVAGTTYQGAMPGWAGEMSDREVAAVLTFIRQWSRNDAPPIPLEVVSSLRSEVESRGSPYTVEALQASEARD